ncbi:unnamed protein product, partial [Symbiodinium sp. KB8]
MWHWQYRRRRAPKGSIAGGSRSSGRQACICQAQPCRRQTPSEVACPRCWTLQAWQSVPGPRRGDDAPSFNGTERSLECLPDAASWLMRECRASLYPQVLEHAGLLPPQEAATDAHVDEVPSPLPSPLPVANEGGGGSFSYLMEAVGSFFRHASCV